MGTVSAGSGFSRVPKENLLDKMFSHVLSVAALASVAVAAPQYYYPGLTPTYYTTGIAQPAAIATPVAVQTPAAAIPAVDLSTLKPLFSSLKALAAQSTAQVPTTQAAADQIQASSLNLLAQVPLETVPIELRADIATLIAASQQLGALNQQTKAANQAELDKILAASNNLLAALPN